MPQRIGVSEFIAHPFALFALLFLLLRHIFLSQYLMHDAARHACSGSLLDYDSQFCRTWMFFGSGRQNGRVLSAFRHSRFRPVRLRWTACLTRVCLAHRFLTRLADAFIVSAISKMVFSPFVFSRIIHCTWLAFSFIVPRLAGSLYLLACLLHARMPLLPAAVKLHALIPLPPAACRSGRTAFRTACSRARKGTAFI